jgi:hypothetical protein
LVADEAVATRIYERLFRNKELICLRIIWIGGGAHFTTIRGCTDPSVGGPFIVSTSDTLEGFSGSTLSYDDFALKAAWVKLGRTQQEHMFSASLSNSNIAQCNRHVSNVPKAISPMPPLIARSGRFQSWFSTATVRGPPRGYRRESEPLTATSLSS